MKNISVSQSPRFIYFLYLGMQDIEARHKQTLSTESCNTQKIDRIETFPLSPNAPNRPHPSNPSHDVSCLALSTEQRFSVHCHIGINALENNHI